MASSRQLRPRSVSSSKSTSHNTMASKALSGIKTQKFQAI